MISHIHAVICDYTKKPLAGIHNSVDSKYKVMKFYEQFSIVQYGEIHSIIMIYNFVSV